MSKQGGNVENSASWDILEVPKQTKQKQRNKKKSKNKTKQNKTKQNKTKENNNKKGKEKENKSNTFTETRKIDRM